MVKNTHKPFFSVIVLSCNRPNFLNIALKSIKAQKFKDYEIIVVDASKPNLKYLVKESGLNIRYYNIKNTNVGKNRDFGLNKAKGGWAAFLDDDDYYLPNHLFERYKIITKNPELDLIYNGFKTVGSRKIPDLFNIGKFLHPDDPRIFHAGTMVVKTKVAKKVGGFKLVKSKNYSDNFYEIAIKNNLKIKRLLIPRTYIYNRSENSLTGTFEKKYVKK